MDGVKFMPRKKIELADEKIVKPKKTSRRGLAKKTVTDIVDYKNDGKEKIFALDIGTRSVIGIVAEQEDNGQLKIIATKNIKLAQCWTGKFMMFRKFRRL